MILHLNPCAAGSAWGKYDGLINSFPEQSREQSEASVHIWTVTVCLSLSHELLLWMYVLAFGQWMNVPFLIIT